MGDPLLVGGLRPGASRSPLNPALTKSQDELHSLRFDLIASWSLLYKMLHTKLYAKFTSSSVRGPGVGDYVAPSFSWCTRLDDGVLVGCNRVFTRSSKRPANVFKIHVLIDERLLEVCWIV